MDERLHLHSSNKSHQNQLQEHHEVFLVLLLPQEDFDRLDDNCFLWWQQLCYFGCFCGWGRLHLFRSLLLAFLEKVPSPSLLLLGGTEAVHVRGSGQLQWEVCGVHPNDRNDQTALHLVRGDLRLECFVHFVQHVRLEKSVYEGYRPSLLPRWPRKGVIPSREERLSLRRQNLHLLKIMILHSL